ARAHGPPLVPYPPLFRSGRLAAPGIVATVMSNLGLERYLAGLGLALARTKVGDRYVVEHMRQHGFNVGGEQSGHIVLSDFATPVDRKSTRLNSSHVKISY